MNSKPFVIYRLLDNSQIRQLADCQLADWTTRELDKSRTGQLADATGDFACLVFVLLAASARPRDVHSLSWQSARWSIRELSSYRSIALAAEIEGIVRSDGQSS